MENQAASHSRIRLGRRVRVEPRYAGTDVDCRLLFMGDRYRQLLRTYPEAVRRLTRQTGPDAIARDLKDSAEVLQFYEVWQDRTAVGLVMRDEIFRAAAPLEALHFELVLWDDARAARYALPLDRFFALGRLLPLLGGDWTMDQIVAGLRQQLSDKALSWAEALLERFAVDGFLEHLSRTPDNFFLRSPERPQVTFVAHTSLLIQSRETAVVLDPLLRTGQAVHERGRDLPRLSLGAICCSHSHWDHCDVASLLLFDKRTPVIVPRVKAPTIFNPPIVTMLKLIGFDDIREADLWTPMRIGDIELIPVPFHGEQDEPGAEIDHYTYVLRTEGLSLYGGVDAFCDTGGDMRPVLDRVRREYAPTVAFLPISEMTYAYATGGVNGFCRSVDTRSVHQEFQYTAGPHLALEWTRLLDARQIVPYATFTFGPLASVPEVQEFSDTMDAAGLGDRLVLLRPLDTLRPSDWTADGRTTRRRRFLRRWMTIAAALSRADRFLGRYLLYRALKRLRRPVMRPGEMPPAAGWYTTT